MYETLDMERVKRRECLDTDPPGRFRKILRDGILSLLLLEERKRVCHAFVGIGSGDMIRVTANDDES